MNYVYTLLILSMFTATCCCDAMAQRSEQPGKATPWICAYYLAGDQDNGRLLPKDIDYTALTHLIHFGIMPNADGTIDEAKSGITPDQSKTVISLAHASGCKVLFCMGSDKNLRSAMSPAYV